MWELTPIDMGYKEFNINSCIALGQNLGIYQNWIQDAFSWINKQEESFGIKQDTLWITLDQLGGIVFWNPLDH